MKELTIYLHFFKKHFYFLSLFSLIGLGIGIFFAITTSSSYISEGVYEIKYTDATVEQKKIETEQLIGVLRTANLVQLLGLTDVQSIEVYKNAPIALHVRLISPQQRTARLNLEKIESFIFSRSSINRLSMQEGIVESPLRYFYPFLGVIAGLIGACFLLLGKIYMRNY